MFRRELVTRIEIESSPERVWSILTAFEEYPRWNPFFRSISGVLREGERLEVRIEREGSRGVLFRPTVLAVDEGRAFRWKGHLLIPGLFDGEHRFGIECINDGGVRFVHGEIFTGLLVPLFWGDLDTKTRRGFEAFNRAIKSRAEDVA